jgi:hypothetical protein
MRDGDCCQLSPTVRMTRWAKIEHAGDWHSIAVPRPGCPKDQGKGHAKQYPKSPVGNAGLSIGTLPGDQGEVLHVVVQLMWLDHGNSLLVGAVRSSGHWRASDWDRVRNIGQRLRRLTNRYGGDHGVGGGVYRDELIGVLETDVNSRAVAGRPDSVRKPANCDSGNLGKIRCFEHLHLIEPANSHIGELTL